jgi:hypothetical protein
MQERHNMHCDPAALPTWISARSLAGTKEQRHAMPWSTIGRTKVQYIYLENDLNSIKGEYFRKSTSQTQRAYRIGDQYSQTVPLIVIP